MHCNNEIHKPLAISTTEIYMRTGLGIFKQIGPQVIHCSHLSSSEYNPHYHRGFLKKICDFWSYVTVKNILDFCIEKRRQNKTYEIV